jgi:hypothetical protein
VSAMILLAKAYEQLLDDFEEEDGKGDESCLEWTTAK